MHKSKRVRRSAEGSANNISLLSLKEPQFVSLVGKPANRTGFKVVRSETGKEKEIKRGEALLVLHLPAGTSADQADSLLDEFGLRGEYRVVAADDNVYLVRKDIDEADLPGVMGNDASVEIPVAENTDAYIDSRVFTKDAARSDRKQYGVKVTAIRFDTASSGWDEEKAKSWVEDHEIDFTDISTDDKGILVLRGEDAKSLEKTDIVDLEKGVQAHIQRAEENDVPVRITRSVTTSAYGSFGYGHLNFVSALADPEFSSKIDHANWVLWDVVDNIMFYSNLPLQERMVLLEAALEDYGTYVKAVIEALPASVLDAVSREDSAKRNDSQSSEHDMSKDRQSSRVRRSAATKKDEPTKDTSTGANEGEESEGEEDPKQQFVTRGELEEVVSSSVRSVLESVGVTGKKGDGEQADGEQQADGKTAKRNDEDDLDERINAIVGKAVAPLYEQVEKMGTSAANALEGIAKRFDEVANSVNDHGDEQDEENTQRSDRKVTPFTGIFGGKRSA